jgi:hypothetical protein
MLVGFSASFISNVSAAVLEATIRTAMLARRKMLATLAIVWMLVVDGVTCGLGGITVILGRTVYTRLLADDALSAYERVYTI